MYGLRLVLVIVFGHYALIALHVGLLFSNIFQILLQHFWSLFLQMLVGVPERVFWVVPAIPHKILSFIFLVAIRGVVMVTNDATDFIVFIFLRELAG